ncbi:rRNA adenine N-6-methyltransferase family protein [Yinghuangia aomiensis]|uniref:rRNA adenine N-6-methyltransferase family protein n=1 Tax=Yinghuangia aomiensis TaxID=676205 RepID=A0ABP9H4E7_9ACTN
MKPSASSAASASSAVPAPSPFRRGTHPLAFVREFCRDRHTTGSVTPSSRALARELTRAVRGAAPDAARTILEVGPGTGSVTRHIADAMTDTDRLDLVEANPRFADLLVHHLGDRAPLADRPTAALPSAVTPAAAAPPARLRGQTRVLTGRVEDLDLGEARYDVVICGLPFATTAPDTAEAILEQLFAALRPRGRLSFFAYAGLPTLHAAVSGPARRRRLALTRHIVRGFVTQYGVDRTLVTGNIPPAWVHHLAAEPVRRTAR